MKCISSLLTVAMLAAVSSSVAQAGWLHLANSVFQVEEDNQKHPSSLIRTVTVREEVPETLVCSAYLNTLAQKNKGRVVTQVEILRGGEAVDELFFAGGVRKNSYLKCKSVGGLEVGDVVVFEFEFKGMARLKKSSSRLDLFEVNGIVSTAGAPAVEDFGLVPAAAGGWVHSANSVFVAEEGARKHPVQLARRILVPGEAVDTEVCVAYSNTADKKRGGRVVTTVRIEHQDGALETLSFAGRVKENAYMKCKPVARLAAGALVEFEFALKGMPKLNAGGEEADFVDLSGAVSTAGEPVFQNPPGVPVAPADAPPPAPAEPDLPPPVLPGGPISAADEVAVSKLLLQNTTTQLQRPNGDNPAKWIAVGPLSRALPCGCKVDTNTAGVGNTIADAVADYERKMRTSLGSGGGLGGSDRAAIDWYSKMSAASGPTSIRRDSGGGFHGEFWRPGRGSIHQGGFGSITAVVNWFKSQGL